MVQSVLEAIWLQSSRRPDASALIGKGIDVTFDQLTRLVSNVSERLEEMGVKPGNKVGICSDNRPECLVAMLAIHYLGAAFVPLAPRDPNDRLAKLAARAELTVAFVSKNRRISGVQSHVDLAGLLALSASEDPAPPRRFGPEDLAYVIFTSGSTGEPKGVCISHRAFWAATDAAAEVMHFGEQTRSLATLPLHFDGSFSAVFPVLARGGSVLVAEGPICPPSRFARLLQRFELTHSTVTPTYLRTLMNEVSIGDEHGSWRTLALGGEAPPKLELSRLRAVLPELRFFNRYGPTEATMAVTTGEISDEMLASAGPIPLGPPHPSVRFCIDGHSDRPIEPGQSGELWVAGTQLMDGYLNDVESTARVFTEADGQRWLRTSDLVKIDEANRYVFVERVDNIVKRNGTRVALAEVEAAFDEVENVVATVCTKVTDGDAVRIIAFVQLGDGDSGDEAALRRHLLKLLPHSMMPDTITFLDALPRASATKVDRKALERMGNDMVAGR